MYVLESVFDGHLAAQAPDQASEVRCFIVEICESLSSYDEQEMLSDRCRGEKRKLQHLMILPDKVLVLQVQDPEIEFSKVFPPC